MYKRFVKRFLDIFIASLGLITFLPILIIIAVLIRIKLGNPIIFKQKRPGKNEKIFEIIKFRSMTNKRNEDGKLLPDEERITKFGMFLRKSSLDEVPELINVIKGDMSLIGPRPLSIKYLPYYNNKEKKRHSVRPGLTGLAQINGRNLSNWDERFRYDIEYVENISFISDMKILIITIKKVFLKEDVIIKEKNELLDFDEYRKEQLKGEIEYV